MANDSLNEVAGINPDIVDGLVAAGAALVGGIIGGAANYLVARRENSRSGTRLLGDLELLEKARTLKLEPPLMAVARVEYSTEKHTKGSVKRKKKRAQREANRVAKSAGMTRRSRDV